MKFFWIFFENFLKFFLKKCSPPRKKSWLRPCFILIKTERKLSVGNREQACIIRWRIFSKRHHSGCCRYITILHITFRSRILYLYWKIKINFGHLRDLRWRANRWVGYTIYAGKVVQKWTYLEKGGKSRWKRCYFLGLMKMLSWH